MTNPFKIVNDSTLYGDPNTSAAINDRQYGIFFGIVKSVKAQINSNAKYLVEIFNKSNSFEATCIAVTRFGGVFNFEDSIDRGYTINEAKDPITANTCKAGDQVVVAFLGGDFRNGVILGGLKHSARKSRINPEDGPQYISEFNGVETHINTDGEYKLTFKGQPTNLKRLLDTPSEHLPAPTYDNVVGSSFLTFTKTGSIEISDNSTTGVQNITIDKPNGIITINGNAVSIKLTKESETIDIKSKFYNLVSDETIRFTTKRFDMDAKESLKIRSPKIAVGFGGNELLDLVSQLAQVVQDIAKENSQEIHPTGVGPSGVPNNASKYSAASQKAQQIKDKVNSIKGSL